MLMKSSKILGYRWIDTWNGGFAFCEEGGYGDAHWLETFDNGVKSLWRVRCRLLRVLILPAREREPGWHRLYSPITR